jgi:hypothetical protein
VRSMAECSAKWDSAPGGIQACGHSKLWDMEALASSEEWISPSWWADVTHGLLLCHLFP